MPDLIPRDELLRAEILVVDDQRANTELVRNLLVQEGYQRVHCENDPTRVPALFRDPGFDLILLDLSMPGMDGFEVMAALAAGQPETYLPILVLTAQPDSATRIRALSSGARDFLAKPFDAVELCTRVRNMLEVRLLHNRARRQNTLLEAMVRQRTRELDDTRLEILRRLGRAAVFRDNETGAHITRMNHFTAHLAKALGLPAEDCELIFEASKMHDIGKIGIPDSILLKPGKLDAEEWAIMKTHTTIGADILSGHHSPLMNAARIIALSHHEKWNGQGYPEGTAGGNIPLFGRITALCDVFDALTMARPYKPAWTVDAAVALIRAERGEHFDPRLVDIFLAELPEILRIKQEFADPDDTQARATTLPGR